MCKGCDAVRCLSAWEQPSQTDSVGKELNGYVMFSANIKNNIKIYKLDHRKIMSTAFTHRQQKSFLNTKQLKVFYTLKYPR